MNQYRWLNERKAQAASENAMAGRRTVGWGSINTLRDRFNLTGAGEDGIVQPNMPVSMIQTMNGPRMIHEGEATMQQPDGSVRVVPQRFLARYEKETNMPGYAIGGTYIPRTPSIPTTTKPTTTTTTVPTTTGPTSSPPSGQTNSGSLQSLDLTVPKPNNTIPNQFTAPTIVKTDAPRIQMPTFEVPIIPQFAKTESISAPTFKPAEFAPIQPPATTTIQTPTISTKPAAAQAPAAQPVVAPTPQTTTVQTPPVAAPQVAAPAIPTFAPANQWNAPPVRGTLDTSKMTNTSGSSTGSLEDRFRTAAMGRMAQMARGSNPTYDAAMQKQLDDLKATQDVENQVARQEMAQGKLNPEAAAARMAMGQAAGRQALADASAQAIIGKGEQQQQAVQNLASQSLSGQQFELSKQRYFDDRRWNEFEKIAEYGSDADVAAAWKATTGSDLTDTAAIKELRDYVRSKRSQELKVGEQTIAQNDITLEDMKSRLGDQKFASIKDRVNSGLSYDAIVKEFGEGTVSANDYATMLEMAPVTERRHNNLVQAANMLLQTPGATNKTQAARLYNQAFPGMGIDFSEIVTAEKSEKFATGLANLGLYVEADLDWDTVSKLIDNDGTLTNLGLTKDDAEKIYSGLKVNVIDDMWSDISGSDWYKNLESTNPDKAEAMKMIFDASITGEMEVGVGTIQEIYDKDGKLVKVLSNERDAQMFVGKNPGYTYKNTGEKILLPKSLNDTPLALTPTEKGETPGGTASFTISNSDGSSNTSQSANLSPVFQAIDEGSEFNTDKYDSQLDVWTKQNNGKTVKIGGVDYIVDRYIPSTKAGEQGQLIVKDQTDGREITFKGTKSELVTTEQRQANNKAVVLDIATGGWSNAVDNVKKGNWGGAALDVLAAGTGFRQLWSWIEKIRQNSKRR